MTTRSGSPRPSRPLGLTLAILASIMLFTIVPLMQASMIALIEDRVRSQPLTIPGQADPIEPLAVGGSFAGVDSGILILQTALGIAFLVIALLAWRGRPSFARYTFIGAIITLTALTLLATLAPLFAQRAADAGFDSGESISRSLLWLRLIFTILVPLYVLWYVNRGPARAFYRGYYLPAPDNDAA